MEKRGLLWQSRRRRRVGRRGNRRRERPLPRQGDAAQQAGELAGRGKDQLAVQLLIEEWRYRIGIADSYENRVVQILLPSAAAAFAGAVGANWTATGNFFGGDVESCVGVFPFGIWSPETAILLFRMLLAGFIELAIVGFVFWMETSFRREAIAEKYLFEIEARLNARLAKPGLPRWAQTYFDYCIAPRRKGMSRKQDPLFPAWRIVRFAALFPFLAIAVMVASKIHLVPGIANFAVLCGVMGVFTPSFDNNWLREKRRHGRKGMVR